jgi:hypothetical protein
VTQWIKGPPSIAQVAQHEKDHPAFVRIAGPHSEAQVRSGDGSEFDTLLSIDTDSAKAKRLGSVMLESSSAHRSPRFAELGSRAGTASFLL